MTCLATQTDDCSCMLLQCFKPTGLIGEPYFKSYGEIVLFNTNYTMRLIVESYAGQLFFRFFLIKTKGWPARKKMRIFYFIYFARTSAPTADRRQTLVPGFQANTVIFYIARSVINCVWQR